MHRTRTSSVFTVVLGALLAAACATSPERAIDDLGLAATTRQVVLVTTADWQASAAEVQRLERRADGWQRVGQVGRTWEGQRWVLQDSSIPDLTGQGN